MANTTEKEVKAVENVATQEVAAEEKKGFFKKLVDGVKDKDTRRSVGKKIVKGVLIFAAGAAAGGYALAKSSGGNTTEEESSEEYSE